MSQRRDFEYRRNLTWVLPEFLLRPDIDDCEIFDQQWGSREEAIEGVFSQIKTWGWEPRIDQDYINPGDEELDPFPVVTIGDVLPSRQYPS
jgi:hypothetical protein